MRPRFYKKIEDLPRGVDIISLPFSPRYSGGVWVYFPWHMQAFYMPPEDAYYQLRTSRNRNLVTTEEQFKFRNFKVGIAGLSVGSAILETLVASGGPKVLKIADPDIIEFTNLNRIKANLMDVGQNKAVVAARRVWEADPFAEIEILREGVNLDNLDSFVLGLDLFIDETDDIKFKMLSRSTCRVHRIPVVMATDLGDGVMLDIERFDLEPSRPLFHGLVDIQPDELDKISKDDWKKLATKIIGSSNMPERLIKSLEEVGKTLEGVPQLGSTAALAGAAATYVVRQIACGYDMPSGRYMIDLGKLISLR